MAVAGRPPRNEFVRSMRRIYNPIGYSKGYNFVLCPSTFPFKSNSHTHSSFYCRVHLRRRPLRIRPSPPTIPRFLRSFLPLRSRRKWFHRHTWNLLLFFQIPALQNRHENPSLRCPSCGLASRLPIHPRHSTYISSLSPHRRLHYYPPNYLW